MSRERSSIRRSAKGKRSIAARPEVLEVVRQWVERAEHDLKTAEHTLTLAQDCIPFPKSHHLTELLALVPAGSKPGMSTADADLMTPLAIVTRYPGTWAMPVQADADDAMRVARAVRTAIRAQLPPEVL